jgi:hypothetical protein
MMNPLFIIGSLLLVFAGFTLLEAVRFARWLDHRRAWTWLGISTPIVAGAFACFWLGVHDPRPRTPAQNALGPDWKCRSYAPGAMVCLKRVPSDAR